MTDRWVPRLVQWNRGVDGYVQSKDGRWSINPMYCGTTRAQAYALWDNKSKKQVGWNDTQRMCKHDAEQIVEREALMPSPRDDPPTESKP